MLLKEAKEILKDAGYICERTAQEHRKFWEWKQEVKAGVMQLLKAHKLIGNDDSSTFENIRSYIRCAIDIDILEEMRRHYEYGETVADYLERIIEWDKYAYEYEG